MVIDSFTIVTTSPNELTAEIHNRMPVIPEVARARDWIEATAEERQDMIQPHDAAAMHVWKVGAEVGSVPNQGETLFSEIE